MATVPRKVRATDHHSRPGDLKPKRVRGHPKRREVGTTNQGTGGAWQMQAWPGSGVRFGNGVDL